MVQGVRKGQTLKASTINGLVDFARNIGFQEKPGNTDIPEPFKLTATGQYDNNLSSVRIDSIKCYDNYINGVKLADRTWTQNFKDISSIYLVVSGDQILSNSVSVVNNLEKRSQHLSALDSYKIYDLNVLSDMTSMFVKEKYPIIIDKGGGGEPYGVFRFKGNTGTTEEEEEGHQVVKPCGTATHCWLQIGRAVVKPANCSDAKFEAVSDGTWYVKTMHNMYSPAAMAYFIKGPSDPSDIENDFQTTWIPIFRIQNQKVVADFRGMPVVPVWGNETT